LKTWATIVSGLAVLLIAGHLFCPAINIDWQTIVLLAIGAGVWIWPTIKSIEVAGNKIELRDMRNATEKIETKLITGVMQATAASVTLKGEGEVKYANHLDTLETIFSSDPALAVVGLGIELEKRARRLAEVNDIDARRMSLGALTRILAKRSILPEDVVSGVSDLIQLRNAAAHGAKVSPEAGAWAIDRAPAILQALDRLIDDFGNMGA
jgi:hypothetical protein